MVLNTFDDKFIKFSKSKFRVCIPITINLILSIILMILSVQQSFPVNEVGDEMILNSYFTGWQRNVCLNRMMQFVSPFLFNMKIKVYNKEYGLMGCPWRYRNTIYRLVIICLIIIISLWMLTILYINNKRRHKNNNNKNNKSDALKGIQIWFILYWFKYILFLSMVILFILDCDGMYAGYSSCLANFDITGLGPIVLQLVGAYFTTTTAPVWPEGSDIADTGDVTIVTEFNVTDQCYITPFIWTCLTDFAIIITSYFVYKISKFVKFDNDDDDDDDNQYEGDNNHQYEGDNNNKRQKRILKTRFGSRQQQHQQQQPQQQENRGRGTNPFGSPAYSVQNSGYIPKKKQSESLFEPHDWNQRKPTYEQNYS